MTSPVDYYTILGVSSGASTEEIVAAYRRRASILHPDRFDQSTQTAESRIAGEMMAQLNVAFQILRNPEKRAAYDRTRQATANHAPDPQRSREEDSTGRGEVESPIRRGRSKFADLSTPAQGQILAQLRGESRSGLHLTLASPLWSFATVAGGVGLGSLLFAQLGTSRWTTGEQWFVFLAVSSILIVVARSAIFLCQWYASTVAPSLVVTPLFVYRTGFDTVEWWPLWEVRKFDVLNHLHSDGRFSHSEVNMICGDTSLHLTFNRKSDVVHLNESLLACRKAVLNAMERNDAQYFIANNLFLECDSPTRETTFRTWLELPQINWGVPIAAICVALLIRQVNASFATERSFKHSYPPGQVAQQREPSRPSPAMPRINGSPRTSKAPWESDPLVLDVRPKKVEFNRPEMPLPANGTVTRFSPGESIAPFSVATRTPGTHFFLKITDADSGSLIATVFVRSGESCETTLPLGRYRVKYATGRKWYGPEFLFGPEPETRYYLADSLLTFTRVGDEVRGYSLELFAQLNGNLKTNEMSGEDW